MTVDRLVAALRESAIRLVGTLRRTRTDRSIVGRALRLNGVEVTVIGVAPAGFTGLDQYGRYDFYATALAVTPVAAYLPARRASLVNRTDALRHE